MIQKEKNNNKTFLLSWSFHLSPCRTSYCHYFALPTQRSKFAQNSCIEFCTDFDHYFRPNVKPMKVVLM